MAEADHDFPTEGDPSLLEILSDMQSKIDQLQEVLVITHKGMVDLQAGVDELDQDQSALRSKVLQLERRV